MLRRLRPDKVGHRILAIVDPGHRLSQRQRCAFGVGEIWRLTPSGDSKQTLIGLAGLPGVLDAAVHAGAAAVDLTGAKMRQMEDFGRGPGLLGGRHQSLYGLHGAWQNGGRILIRSCMTLSSHIGLTSLVIPMTDRAERM